MTRPAQQLGARPASNYAVVKPLRLAPAARGGRERGRRMTFVALGALLLVTALGTLYMRDLLQLPTETLYGYSGPLLAVAGGGLCLAALLLVLPRPRHLTPRALAPPEVVTALVRAAGAGAVAFAMPHVAMPADWLPAALVGLVLIVTAAPAANPLVPLAATFAAVFGYASASGWQHFSVPLGVTLAGTGLLVAVWPARLRAQARRHVQEADTVTVKLGALEIQHAGAVQASEIATAVLAMANACNTALDPAGIADQITKSTSAHLGAVGTVLLLWDETLESFRVGSVDGHHAPGPAELRQVEVRPDTVPTLRADTGSAIVEVEPGALREPMLKSLLQRWKAITLLGTRLQRGDRLLGLLFVARATTQARFAPRDAQILGGVAVHAAAALSHANLIADLQAANHLKEEFMATMSHELRTPLNVIIGYTDFQLEGAFGDLGEEHVDTLRRVREQALQLLEMIQATLDTSRLERGLVTVDLHDVAIGPFIERLKAQVPGAWRKPTVELTWRCQTGLPTIRTDPGKLQIILRNLIHNALKFTHNGLVSVSVSPNADKQRVTFVVQDSGVGIRAEHLSEIFEMFRQAPAEGTNPGGVGLGLYIVKRLATVLGAEIEVSSAPQRGATFRVHVPISGPLAVKG